MELQDVIRIRRAELGLTLDQIAKACGVGRSIVAKWERGEVTNIRRDNLSALADILRVSPLVLLDREELSESGHHIIVSDRERTLIQRYRQLDDRGKATVDGLVENEYRAQIGDAGNSVSGAG